MPGMNWRDNRTAWFFLMPTVIVLGIFLLYPIVWSLLASFRTIGPGDLMGMRPGAVPGQWTGLRNYRLLLDDPIVWRSLVNTAFFAALFIPGTLVISMSMALLTREGLRGTGGFRVIFFLPYVVSIVAAGLVWRWMFDTEHGLANALIVIAGGDAPNWLGHPQLAMLVIALMCIWRWSGYFMLIFLAGLQNVPPELYEAAAVDGASRLSVFLRITLPLMKRPLLFALIVMLIRAQNVFQEVYVMTGGGPADGTVTVAFQIWRTAFKYFLIGRGAALSYLLFMVVLLVAAAQWALLMRRRAT